MRRSGSSSCLLRPKSEMDGDEEPLSVTLINTQPLPTYSTERFYMLSELELKAHSTLFLSDYSGLDDETLDTMESSEVGDAFAPFGILYLLWQPDRQQSRSVRAFCEGPITDAIQKLKQIMDGSRHKLYLVVDIVASPATTATSEAEDALRRRFQVKVDMAERLARHVAQSTSLRLQVDGITVGVSDHVRAAPGLECCLNAVSVGARDRRRISTHEKSLVGLVVNHPDDLLGLQDEAVTDAAQGVLQSCTCAEWNGNGNLQSFARRAHSIWCARHHVSAEKTPAKRRNKEDDFVFMDPMTSLLFLIALALAASYFWGAYSERVQQLLTRADSVDDQSASEM